MIDILSNNEHERAVIKEGDYFEITIYIFLFFKNISLQKKSSRLLQKKRSEYIHFKTKLIIERFWVVVQK